MTGRAIEVASAYSQQWEAEGQPPGVCFNLALQEVPVNEVMGSTMHRVPRWEHLHAPCMAVVQDMIAS